MTSNRQQFRYGKLLALLFFSCMAQSSAFAQEKLYDSVAIKLLDKMTSFIGNLSSCSFKAHTIQDETDEDYGLLTHNQYSTDSFQGDHKFQVMTEGHKGKAGYWYNGEKMVYYSFTHNFFGSSEHSLNCKNPHCPGLWRHERGRILTHFNEYLKIF